MPVSQQKKALDGNVWPSEIKCYAWEQDKPMKKGQLQRYVSVHQSQNADSGDASQMHNTTVSRTRFLVKGLPMPVKTQAPIVCTQMRPYYASQYTGTRSVYSDEALLCQSIHRHP